MRGAISFVQRYDVFGIYFRHKQQWSSFRDNFLLYDGEGERHAVQLIYGAGLWLIVRRRFYVGSGVAKNFV